MQPNYEGPLAGTRARRHYLGFSPSICSIRSLPAFSKSASVWPRSPLTVSFVGLGSSSAHRPAKRQQIDRNRFNRSSSSCWARTTATRRSWSELSISEARISRSCAGLQIGEHLAQVLRIGCYLPGQLNAARRGSLLEHLEELRSLFRRQPAQRLLRCFRVLVGRHGVTPHHIVSRFERRLPDAVA
jgi:hypothetical protein